MNIDKFNEKLGQGDFKFRNYQVSMLPNWKSDGENCIAQNKTTTYRGTPENIHRFIDTTGAKKKEAKLKLFSKKM